MFVLRLLLCSKLRTNPTGQFLSRLIYATLAALSMAISVQVTAVTFRVVETVRR